MENRLNGRKFFGFLREAAMAMEYMAEGNPVEAIKAYESLVNIGAPEIIAGKARNEIKRIEN